jgi:hypothetical protein
MTTQSHAAMTADGSTNYKLHQRIKARDLLIKQLESNCKPTKGKKPLKTDANGLVIYTKNRYDIAVPERLDHVPLTFTDISRINNQILSLERKILWAKNKNKQSI